VIHAGQHTDGSAAVAAAAALGLPALAGVVAGAQDGITLVDAERRFVYANPAACVMLGSDLAQLQGRDFLDSIPTREHAFVLARFSDQFDRSVTEVTAPFTCNLRGPDGAQREVVCSTFAIDVSGSRLGVAIFEDLTGPRAATRTATALAQTTAQLVGPGTTDEILAGIARHAVEGTRALACGIDVVGDDHKLVTAGGHGFTARIKTREARTAGRITLADLTGGTIVLGDVPGKPVVQSDARAIWEANPVVQPFAATISTLDWQGAVYVPLSWENQVLGFVCVYLPSGLAGPSEAELAFYTALADQAAVAVINARLSAQASQAATSLERARLARELHDSVSQALFSMTMHARAAQLAMTNAGVDGTGPLGRSIAELAELTRGALAEMRALIFELRPAALGEEGLVAALRKQGVALGARDRLVITVDGPEERLNLSATVEEHLYRIASEALHNVVNHAEADGATVSVTVDPGNLRLEIRDDGAGFDQDAPHPGHLGLSTMAERAKTIGARLAVTSAPGQGTTVSVSLGTDRLGQGTVGSPSQGHGFSPGVINEPGPSDGHRPPGQRPAGGEPSDVALDLVGSSALTDAAALGVSALAGVLAGAQEGITIADARRHFVYANPAACQMLDRPLEQLRGRDFMSIIPPQEKTFALDRFSERLGRSPGETAAAFSAILLDPDGEEREIVCSTFATDMAEGQHGVTIFRDVTGARAATRAAVALAQTASQLVGAGTTDDILAGIARHAVEGTRALGCGIAVVDDNDKMSVAGRYGHDQGPSPAGGDRRGADATPEAQARHNRVFARLQRHMDGLDAGSVVEAITAGSIVVGGVPGRPVVLSDARSVWEANPVTEPFVVLLSGLDWEAGVYVPLSWKNRVIGLFAVYLPSGLAGPSEAELAFYTALADQAAVVVTNARLSAQAAQAAALVERSRLARELHDSVSQGLFSMTMHARAAQLSMVRAGLDAGGPLGRSIAGLAELTRGALAEMRALIFELRPAALAEEGLVAALRKQGAAVTVRDEVVVTVDGPEERLALGAGVEEHLYRIASEALQNVVKHARADRATVTVAEGSGRLRLAVSDDGYGFDQARERPGHLGLSTMAERAETIGATLAISSAPGDGTSVMVSLAHDRWDEPEEALNGH
jgi:PAS domain S-box-containing protein